MAFEQTFEVVRQGVVDGGFHVAVKAQQPLVAIFALGVMRAVFDVVAQHLLVPSRERLLAAEMPQYIVQPQPLVFALAADGTRRDRTHQLRAFGHTQCGGTPAAQDGRIDQQHPAHRLAAEHGVARGAHQA
jgi:hypothetical protein